MEEILGALSIVVVCLGSGAIFLSLLAIWKGTLKALDEEKWFLRDASLGLTSEEVSRIQQEFTILAESIATLSQLLENHPAWEGDIASRRQLEATKQAVTNGMQLLNEYMGWQIVVDQTQLITTWAALKQIDVIFSRHIRWPYDAIQDIGKLPRLLQDLSTFEKHKSNYLMLLGGTVLAFSVAYLTPLYVATAYVYTYQNILLAVGEGIFLIIGGGCFWKRIYEDTLVR